MTQRDKLILRILSKPRDFTWHELEKLLAGLGYRLTPGGKTGGSRARFIHDAHPPIIMHKPHPRPILKQYQIEDIIELLTREGLL